MDNLENMGFLNDPQFENGMHISSLQDKKSIIIDKNKLNKNILNIPWNLIYNLGR